MVGGVTWLDTTLVDMKGANAVNNGHQVVGIPRWQGNFYNEYALPQLRGLTGVLNLHYTGRRAADAENYSWAAGYFTTDIGAATRPRSARKNSPSASWSRTCSTQNTGLRSTAT